jgi:hypothetical protein
MHGARLSIWDGERLDVAELQILAFDRFESPFAPTFRHVLEDMISSAGRKGAPGWLCLGTLCDISPEILVALN